MKTISVALDAHYAGETLTVADCVLAVLKNGDVYGFTSFDDNLTIDGVEHLGGTYTTSNIETSAALDVDNSEIVGLLGRLESAALTEADLHAGLWDDAEIKIFQVNWADLSQGKLKLRSGNLGEVSIGRDTFKADLFGLLKRLQTVIGRLVAPNCPYTFGDADCKFPIATVTSSHVVASVDSYNLVIGFEDATVGSPAEPHLSGWFDFGLIRFTSGANFDAGSAEMEIKSHTVSGSPPEAQVTLQLPMPYPIEVGDEFDAVAGCAKRHNEDCRDQWNNLVNFGGFADLPGQNKTVSIAQR